MFPSNHLARIEQRIKQLHDEAHSAVFRVYLRKGIFPPRLVEIMEVTSSIKAFIDYTFKYNSDQPRVPAGSPGGGQWTDGAEAGSDINDTPIQPVYPLETAILLFLGGASAIGDAIGGAAESALDAGAEDALGAGASDISSVTQAVVNALAPDGELIGAAGSESAIREIQGGAGAAEDILQNITKDGTFNFGTSYKGTAWTLPDGSFIGYRVSDSGIPTIDLNIPYFGDTLRKLKFLN